MCSAKMHLGLGGGVDLKKDIAPMFGKNLKMQLEFIGVTGTHAHNQ